MKKIKRPKKIKILNTTLKIKYDKNKFGGQVILSKDLIIIGTNKIQREEEILDTIIHEVSEAIHTLIGTAYYKKTEDVWKFHLNHAEFQLHNTILTATLYKYFI